MRNIINIFMVPLLALATVSCTEGTHDNPILKGDAELSIMPQVTGAIQTRAAVAGTAFGAGAQVGLRVGSSTQTLNSMYDNFYAFYSGSNWSYILNGVNVGTKLSGFSNWNKVTVMGYYPYSVNAVDFDAIPFRIAGDDGVTTTEVATTDYMVAATKEKTMAAGESTVTLEFEHLMTYIYLYLYRPHQGVTLTLSKVILEIDNRDFVVAGTYDAREPDMNDVPALITSTKTTRKLEITMNQAISASYGVYTTIPLVIMPQLAVAHGDAAIMVTFCFTDADGQPLFDQGDPVMTFNLSDVDSGQGFLRGKSYRITGTLGTYVHFEGAPVVDYRQMDGDTDPEHIEI